jgi:hypothetical protein
MVYLKGEEWVVPRSIGQKVFSRRTPDANKVLRDESYPPIPIDTISFHQVQSFTYLYCVEER